MPNVPDTRTPGVSLGGLRSRGPAVIADPYTRTAWIKGKNVGFTGTYRNCPVYSVGAASFLRSTNGQVYVNEIDQYEFRDKPMTVLAVTHGDIFSEVIRGAGFSFFSGGATSDRIRFTGSTSAYAEANWQNVSIPHRSGSWNCSAFVMPASADLAAVSGIRVAKNGIVANAKEAYNNGAVLPDPSKTSLGANAISFGFSTNFGLVKIWDRALSDEELARETIDPFHDLHLYTRRRRLITQNNFIRPLIISRDTGFRVGGHVEKTSLTSWNLDPGSDLNISRASTWNVFYEMIIARGSVWDIKKTIDRNPFLKPHNGEVYARVILPSLIRLDRYENVLPNADTSKFKFTAGLGNTTLTITKNQ